MIVLVVFIMVFTVVFTVVFIMILFMHNRTLWNLIVVKLRILVGKTDIQTTEIVLVREVMAITIIDRLSFQTQGKRRFFKVCFGNGIVDDINYSADGAIGIQ